ncbi:S-layer homology domain-containing protein [Herbiconiux sp. SYSU D00978]|uniref:S-layer homology domain-containing protein n=1 Tax=Herbiconiux sp. SYSU D00978 TaxID=2812562 RepID=UPI001F6012F6|nr:S-layer homology domain-containing protein [Herbiconiux sp. SYSU D00978]
MLRENRPTAFSDVRESDPDHDSIRWASEVGISRGYPDGSYRPDEVVSRQAAAAFLYRAFSTAGSSAPEADPAGDVPASHPFSREIGWYLTSRGLRGCERFEPDGPFLESDLRDALVALGHPAPESAFSYAEVPVTRRQIARVLHLLKTPTTLA